MCVGESWGEVLGRVRHGERLTEEPSASWRRATAPMGRAVYLRHASHICNARENLKIYYKNK